MLADLVDYLLHQRFRLLQPAVEQDQTELVTAQPSGQSLLRSWCRISWAMSRSKASPAAWPAVSFTALNRSRSRNTSECDDDGSPPAAIAAFSCFSKRVRFGRPVSASCEAL